MSFINLIFFFSILYLKIFAFDANLTSSVHLEKEYAQWFMGPILTPNPTTVKPGHPGLELEVIASKNYGFYDAHGKLQDIPAIWSIRPLFDFQVGFNKIIGIELIGSMVTNFSQGASSTHLSDSIFRLGFQMSTDKEASWIPDFRILFQEIFPTGRYQKLDPKKNGTDSTGQGSFKSGIQFVFQKAFRAKEPHPFRIRGSIGYFIPSPIAVKGLNCYGGDFTTRGTVYLGKYFSGFFYGEYALSRTWALACEFNYLQGEGGKFSKKTGRKIDIPSFNQWSFLPEIQHTFTQNVGVILGGWFTVAGKNSPAFSDIFCAVLLLF